MLGATNRALETGRIPSERSVSSAATAESLINIIVTKDATGGPTIRRGGSEVPLVRYLRERRRRIMGSDPWRRRS
jgi:hypothetical protein